MSWSRAADFKSQLQRLWERGRLLQSEVDGLSLFPLRLAMKRPSSSELAERFEAVRSWIADLQAMPHVRIEWRDLQHRLLGAQRVPHSAWIDDVDSAAALLGKYAQLAAFRQRVQQIRDCQPALLPWLARRPLQALELGDTWPRLLAVVSWLQGHPRPGMYLRQADIRGVHSKFIEAHRGVLSEWLDLALPASAIADTHTGQSGFLSRYGFLDKPLRIRFRILDPDIALLPGCHYPDITLDADNFARLQIPAHRILITENETNFLALPAMPRALAIFGAGYGWRALASAQWLQHCELRYWGDIDSHGFAILSQLRKHFPKTRSLLMDHATLQANREHWGQESHQIRHELPGLSNDEQALYDQLRDNRIATNLRLEQEHIGFKQVRRALADLGWLG